MGELPLAISFFFRAENVFFSPTTGQMALSMSLQTSLEHEKMLMMVYSLARCWLTTVLVILCTCLFEACYIWLLPLQPPYQGGYSADVRVRLRIGWIQNLIWNVPWCRYDACTLHFCFTHVYWPLMPSATSVCRILESWYCELVLR